MARQSLLPIWVCLLLATASCTMGPEKGEAEYTAHLKLAGSPPVGLRGVAFDLVGDLRNYEPMNYHFAWSGSVIDSVVAEYAQSGADTLVLSQMLRVNAGRYQVSAWTWGLADTLDSDSSSTRVLASSHIYLRSETIAGDLLFEGPWPGFSATITAKRASDSTFP